MERILSVSVRAPQVDCKKRLSTQVPSGSTKTTPRKPVLPKLATRTHSQHTTIRVQPILNGPQTPSQSLGLPPLDLRYLACRKYHTRAFHVGLNPVHCLQRRCEYAARRRLRHARPFPPARRLDSSLRAPPGQQLAHRLEKLGLAKNIRSSLGHGLQLAAQGTIGLLQEEKNTLTAAFTSREGQHAGACVWGYPCQRSYYHTIILVSLTN